MDQSKQNSTSENEIWFKKNNFMGKFLSEESQKIIEKINKKNMKNLIFSLLFVIAANAQYSEALEFHNQVRSYYDLTPLSYSDNLSYEAQRWAEHIASIDDLMNSSDSYGENIFRMDRSYYIEYKKNPYLEASINWLIDTQNDLSTYNQALYYNASQVGFGFAENNESIYVVAKYDKLYY